MSYRRGALISLLFLLLIGLVMPQFNFLNPLPIPRAHAASRSIRLNGAYLSGWNGTNPGPTITVTKGDNVMMSLLSGDGFTHTFIVDVDKSAITSAPNCSVEKCSPSFYIMSVPTSFPFTVDFGPGTFTYYCSVHLSSMVGTFIVTTPGPDYSVSSSPSSLAIPLGGSSNSTVSVSSLYSFSGSVTLSSSTSSPPGLTSTTFNVNPVTVPSGSTEGSNFTIAVPTNVQPGLYRITVTAKNSTNFSRTTTLSITVPTPDFSLAASPSTLTIGSGASGNLSLTIKGLYGFSGTVNLAGTVPPGRGTANLNPMSVMLSSTVSSATSTLSISSALGDFNTTLTATSGSSSHSIQVQINGPDFTITTNPTSLTLSQDASATLTITLSGIHGFSGSVSLLAFVAPSNGAPPVSLSPTSLQVPATGNITSTLTVMASSTGAYSSMVSTGSYSITLNATTGSLSHAETIPLTVTSSSLVVGLLANSVAIGGVVSVIAIVVVALYMWRRRPKR